MTRPERVPIRTTKKSPFIHLDSIIPTLTNKEARLISIHAQALDFLPIPTSPPDKQHILNMFHRPGVIQLDSISVVARSHETVLWSRLGPFDPNLVFELYSPDKQLAEYLAHAAAIVPVDLMPFFRRRMYTYRDPNSTYYEDVNASVLAQIRESGPQTSRAFERPEGPRPAPWSWWGDKPAKKALDYLWTSGQLSISKREGFQRVYDLMERRFPTFHEQSLPTVEDQHRTFVSRALSAMGLATARWTTDYFRTGGQAHVPIRDSILTLRALSEDGLAIPVRIEGIAEDAWLDPAMVQILDDIRTRKLDATRTTVLSPFDSLVWFRQRTERLFNFAYRIECYTPAPKRLYGYYSLPILHHGRIVGRLDPTFDRKRGVLTIKAIHLEPGIASTPLLAKELVASLVNYCTFLGGNDLIINASFPEAIGALMQRECA